MDETTKLQELFDKQKSENLTYPEAVGIVSLREVAASAALSENKSKLVGVFTTFSILLGLIATCAASLGLWALFQIV